VAALELEVAQRLADMQSPVAFLDARVKPRVCERDGFAVTFWTYYELRTAGELLPGKYADALQRLHAGMRRLNIATPHFARRVAEAEGLVASRHETPALAESDRELLMHTLQSARRTIADSGAAEQLLHGEPHPGNIIRIAAAAAHADADGGAMMLIDWDTVGLAPPERDLWMVATETGAELRRYTELTGRPVDMAAIELYRLRWALDDLSCFVRDLRAPHHRTPGTEHAWQALQLTITDFTTPA
jgi:thiamine kinase-like enzyme